MKKKFFAVMAMLAMLLPVQAQLSVRWGNVDTRYPVNAADAVSSAAVPAPKPAGDSMADFKQKLEKLMLMKEMGALSEEEFAAAKANLLSQL